MKDNLSLLTSRLAKMTEDGFNKQLNRSLFYAPFRLFYNLFRKKNPHIIHHIKTRLATDIEEKLVEINGFQADLFINENGLTDQGKLMMKRSYNIGIRLVRKTGVKTAFKALRNRTIQQELYDYILTQTEEKASKIMENL